MESMFDEDGTYTPADSLGVGVMEFTLLFIGGAVFAVPGAVWAFLLPVGPNGVERASLCKWPAPESGDDNDG